MGEDPTTGTSELSFGEAVDGASGSPPPNQWRAKIRPRVPPIFTRGSIAAVRRTRHGVLIHLTYTLPFHLFPHATSRDPEGSTSKFYRRPHFVDIQDLHWATLSRRTLTVGRPANKRQVANLDIRAVEGTIADPRC